jgi:hypothetical protein
MELVGAGQRDADELHCTALGKAIPAHISEELVPDLRREPLKPLTSYTITDRRVLFRLLREVRQRGYSIDREENEVGFVCFAAPIIDPHCFPVGTISVSLPTRRMSEQLDLDISDAVVTAGLMITRRLRADGISTPSADPSTSRRGFAPHPRHRRTPGKQQFVGIGLLRDLAAQYRMHSAGA